MKIRYAGIRFRRVAASLALQLVGIAQRAKRPSYDVLIRGGTIYDGSGGAPYVGDVAIKGDKIVYVGPQAPGRARARSTRPARRSRPASSTC